METYNPKGLALWEKFKGKVFLDSGVEAYWIMAFKRLFDRRMDVVGYGLCTRR